MDVLESILAVLSPLREFTDLLAGEKRVTASAVLPFLNHIKTNILVSQEEETDLTKEMKDRIKLDLLSHYNESTTHFLEICTFMDPRFKLTPFSTETCHSLELRVETELLQVQLTGTLDVPVFMSIEEPPAKKPKTVWGKIFGTNDDTVQNDLMLSPKERIEKELTEYKYIPKPHAESDPLKWWKQHYVQFHLLHKMAKKYLNCCATSVSSDRDTFLIPYHVAKIPIPPNTT